MRSYRGRPCRDIVERARHAIQNVAEMTEPAWTEAFPGLATLPRPLLEHITARSQRINLHAGTRIFGPGQAPESFMLLLDGTVRVQQVSEAGREIVLYRVSAGESCALTTACLLGYEDYQAEAISETPVRAVAIPRAAFDDLIATSLEFRRFVFTAFSRRVTDLFRVIDEVAFQRLDIRLAQKLVDLAGPGDAVTVTHQQLATELGSAREVVSRLVGEFHRRGLIQSSRGHLAIRDRQALEQLARSH